MTSPGPTPWSRRVAANPSAARSSQAYVTRFSPWTYASRSGCAAAAARSRSAVVRGLVPTDATGRTVPDS